MSRKFPNVRNIKICCRTVLLIVCRFMAVFLLDRMVLICPFPFNMSVNFLILQFSSCFLFFSYVKNKKQ